MKEELDLPILEKWMEDLGLVILKMDDWLLVQRASFDFYLEGEPHNSLQLLINMNLRKYIIRVWSRTYEKGQFESIAEVESITKKYFLRLMSCTGYLESISQHNTCLKHLEYPFKRWISSSCVFLFSGDLGAEKVGICFACSETPISKVEELKLESECADPESLLENNYVVDEKPEVLANSIFEDAIEEDEIEVKQEMYEASYEFDPSKLGKNEVREDEKDLNDDHEGYGDNSSVARNKGRTKGKSAVLDSDSDWMPNKKKPDKAEKKTNCEDCSAEFSNRSLLKRHERSEHSKFVCERCGIKLSDLPSLTAHKTEAHNLKFSNGVMKNILSLPPWLESENCVFCNEHFNVKENLKNHLRYKHGYNTYKCHQCAERCYFPRDIAQHILDSHPGNETAHCPLCKGPVFFGGNVQDFIDHQKHCRTERRKKYVREKKKRRPPVPQPKLACHICGKLMSSQFTLKSHVARHNKSDLPFKCDFEGCDMAFPVLTELKL